MKIPKNVPEWVGHTVANDPRRRFERCVVDESGKPFRFRRRRSTAKAGAKDSELDGQLTLPSPPRSDDE